RPSDPEIDLQLSDTRAHIVDTTNIFAQKLGFDGIHYDIEPVINNDNHFLDLLSETRGAIGTEKLLSVATPNWVPIARVTDLLGAISDRPNVWWTTYYYQKISQYVDQIVAMMYNTGMPTAPMYEAAVQQETAHILRAVQRGSSKTQLIVGVASFDEAPSRAF